VEPPVEAELDIFDKSVLRMVLNFVPAWLGS
jgi:hypothetical protein